MAKARRSAARSGRANRAAAPGEELEQQARLAVNLPLKTHRLLKARAAEEGSSIRDYVLALLRQNGIT